MNRILVDETSYGTRIGVVENGTLVELIYENKNSLPIVGNVYAGKIMNVLPGMQALLILAEKKMLFFITATIKTITET